MRCYDYLANYVINQWSSAFGPISNPSVFEVLYLVKYIGGFRYFISHDITNRFKNAVTLHDTSIFIREHLLSYMSYIGRVRENIITAVRCTSNPINNIQTIARSLHRAAQAFRYHGRMRMRVTALVAGALPGVAVIDPLSKRHGVGA